MTKYVSEFCKNNFNIFMNIKMAIAEIYGGIPLAPRVKAVLTLVLILVLALWIVQPIKRHTWNTIKNRGDNALARRDYATARLEYTKLRLISPRSPEPKILIDRVVTAGNDLLSLRTFYEGRGDVKILDMINSATRDYTSAEEAVVACQTLLKDREIDLAKLCIDRAGAKWPLYKEGWLTARAIAKITEDEEAVKNAETRLRQIDPNIILPD